jgi:hypothetical protein
LILYKRGEVDELVLIHNSISSVKEAMVAIENDIGNLEDFNQSIDYIDGKLVIYQHAKGHETHTFHLI